MKVLNQRYSYWHNVKHGKTGHLWEARFHSRIIDKGGYFLVCSKYIELNPVRAGLVTNPKKYVWSSYNRHAYGKEDVLVDMHELFLDLGTTEEERQEYYRDFLAVAPDAPEQKVSDTCIRKGGTSIMD